MTKVDEEYNCKLCGNTVKVILAGMGTLSCCGSPMELVQKQEPTHQPIKPIELAPKQESMRIPSKPTEPFQKQEPEQPVSE